MKLLFFLSSILLLISCNARNIMNPPGNMEHHGKNTSLEKSGDSSYKYLALSNSRIFHKKNGCLKYSDSDDESITINGKISFVRIRYEDNYSIKFDPRERLRGVVPAPAGGSLVVIDTPKDAPIIIKSKNILFFKEKEDAVKSGRTPCEYCCH